MQRVVAFAGLVIAFPLWAASNDPDSARIQGYVKEKPRPEAPTTGLLSANCNDAAGTHKPGDAGFERCRQSVSVQADAPHGEHDRYRRLNPAEDPSYRNESALPNARASTGVTFGVPPVQ